MREADQNMSAYNHPLEKITILLQSFRKNDVIANFILHFHSFKVRPDQTTQKGGCGMPSAPASLAAKKPMPLQAARIEFL